MSVTVTHETFCGLDQQQLLLSTSCAGLVWRTADESDNSIDDDDSDDGYVFDDEDVDGVRRPLEENQAEVGPAIPRNEAK